MACSGKRKRNKLYQNGLDVLGDGGDGNHHCLTWWEASAIVIGAFAALATLIEVSFRMNGRMK